MHPVLRGQRQQQGTLTHPISIRVQQGVDGQVDNHHGIQKPIQAEKQGGHESASGPGGVSHLQHGPSQTQASTMNWGLSCHQRTEESSKEEDTHNTHFTDVTNAQMSLHGFTVT